MLSRRNIRIKIMQILYGRMTGEEAGKKEVIGQYRDRIQNSFELYLYTLYALIEVTSFARLDKEKRRSKHLPTDKDKNFSPRIYENPLLQSLVNNPALQKRFKELKFAERTDSDVLKEVYKKYSKEQHYLDYIYGPDTPEAHMEALLDLFRFVKKNELFAETIEDQYYSWADDKSLVVGAMKKTIKALPGEGAFYKEFQADEDTTENFGLKLITGFLDKEDELLEFIKPNLVNWEAERLAQLDLILLKMGLSELISFPTIPTKVTLNEYVEISKKYSTDKSKEFINGILDKLMKKLQESGDISKEGRGLIGS